MAEDTVRVSATLTRDTFRRLNSLAASRGVTMTRILEKSIDREHYFYEVVRNGGKVLTEDRNRKFQIIPIDDK